MTTDICPAPAPDTLDALSELAALDEAAFVDRLGGVVEHAPWVAQRVWRGRPWADGQALYGAFVATITGATEAEQLALLRRHPELAGREAQQGQMTSDSTSEQGRLGLLALDATQLARLADLNRRYQARFGFPFIVALRLHTTLDSVFQAFEQRLNHHAAQELQAALQQVCEVTRGRLQRAISDPTPPAHPTKDTP